MGAVVDGGELRGGELGVALGCGEALVAEEFLNGAEVGALFKQVSSECVAQGVRVNVRGKAAQDGDALDDASDAACGEARLAAALKAAQLQIEKEGGRVQGPLAIAGFLEFLSVVSASGPIAGSFAR